MADWETIKLPKDMVKRIEDIADSQFGKELGFTSKSQIAVTAVREFLRQYSEFMAYMELKDISKDTVILHDYNIKSNVKVKITGKSITCDRDQGHCKHIDFVNMLPRVNPSKKT